MNKTASLPNPTFITARERQSIVSGIHAQPVLTGCDRSWTPAQALTCLTELLWDRGFSLDMATVLPSAGKGRLSIPFRRSSEEDCMPDIENNRIVFAWENLGTQFKPRFEFIAYVS